MFVVAASAMLFTTCKDDKDNLSVSPAELTFHADDVSVKTVTVETNVKDWDATPSFNWINIQKRDGMFTVTVDLYKDVTAPRTGTISVKAAGKEEIISVYQSAAEEHPTFDTAKGYYFGNYGNGTAIFGLDMFNASDDMAGLQILGFSAFAPLNNYKLDVGTYNLTEYGEIKSFLDGWYDNEEDMPFGTFLYDSKLGKLTLITGGTFSVELSNNTYTVTTNFTGKDAFTNATVNNIHYRFVGKIEFEDLSIDMSSTGIVESDYTATGTPQLSFQDEVANETEWNGRVVPVEDDDFGQYIAITNFADQEDLTIYADFIGGDFILDTQYPVWENDNHVGFLVAVLYYEDKLYAIDPDMWDMSIQYDHESQTFDFSKSVNISGIGTQNISVGVYTIQKSNGEGVGWLTNIYPDIKLELTPISPTQTKALMLSNKKQKVISPSKLPSFTPRVDKKVITIDKSQLVPFDKNKFFLYDSLTKKEAIP